MRVASCPSVRSLPMAIDMVPSSVYKRTVHDPDLSPESVLASLHLSRATVYGLFEHDGGLAAYIRSRRLRMAAHDSTTQHDRRRAEKMGRSRCAGGCKRNDLAGGASPGSDPVCALTVNPGTRRGIAPTSCNDRHNTGDDAHAFRSRFELTNAASPEFLLSQS
jgi:hypothetical protein